MKKLSQLYQNYISDKNDEVHLIISGGESMEEFQNFLKSKLSADDYFTAEDLLVKLISEKEEAAFVAGCKYTSGLAKELFTE